MNLNEHVEMYKVNELGYLPLKTSTKCIRVKLCLRGPVRSKSRIDSTMTLATVVMSSVTYFS